MRGILASPIAFVLLIGATGCADARVYDHPNYGYCPDGKRVTDIKKCNRNPDGSCKPGRHCKDSPRQQENQKR